VRGFVYENANLSFFAAPEGRVVKNGSNYEQQYTIADNQGNTRAVFTSVAPATYAPIATLEGDASDDTDEYSGVSGSAVVPFSGAAHSGTHVVRMRNDFNFGMAKSMHVYPGDKIDIEVWEYHEGTGGYDGTSPSLSTMITAIAGAFGGASGGGGESQAIYDGVNSALTATGTGGNQGTSRPSAYLNYILFDKNYKFLDAGWQLAPNTTFTKQKLSFPTKNIVHEGYMFVYLSYENDASTVPVYFDDLKVTHTPSNVIQYNEYYPFGLQTASSWTRENSKDNNYLYNAANELNKESGWYEMFYRGYDPTTGRMLQVDPYATMYASVSTYNYGLNNPVPEYLYEDLKNFFN
jgi:RHS repeat-associated protein